MLKTVAKLALLRFLPRRILPIVTVVEILMFLRSVRRRPAVQVTQVDEPVTTTDPG